MQNKLFDAALANGFATITVTATHADGGAAYANLNAALQAVALFDGILSAEKGEGAAGTLIVAYDFGISWMGTRTLEGKDYLVVEATLKGGVFADGTAVELIAERNEPLATAEAVASRDGESLGIGESATQRWFRVPLENSPETLRLRVRAVSKTTL